MRLKEGCPGCERSWKAPNAEGQCSRCKRCLNCCNRRGVPYTCAWRYARLKPDHQLASDKAYERWASNPKILSRNRRIV